jgi:7-carboxy-7-deazaguanine synthase
MLSLNISEIFYSIQGEGVQLGIPSIFIRTSSCNLRCSWCDTPYTSWKPEKNKMTIDEILNEVEKLTPQTISEPLPIILTGGEPYLQPNIVVLIQKLKDKGHFITVETNATIFLSTKIDFYSLSPKLANSTPSEPLKWNKEHEKVRINFDAIISFIKDCENSSKDYQFKFVVENENDIEEIKELIKVLQEEYTLYIPHEKILLMPQGRSSKEIKDRYLELVSICLKENFRLTPRLHVDIWGDKRGV